MQINAEYMHFYFFIVNIQGLWFPLHTVFQLILHLYSFYMQTASSIYLNVCSAKTDIKLQQIPCQENNPWTSSVRREEIGLILTQMLINLDTGRSGIVCVQETKREREREREKPRERGLKKKA